MLWLKIVLFSVIYVESGFVRDANSHTSTLPAKSGRRS
jgi:hypothetical protein